MSLEEIKNGFMELFLKESVDLNGILSFNAVSNFYQALNPKEQDLLNPAVQALLDEGFVTEGLELRGRGTIKLTEMGFNRIYPGEDESIQTVKRKIIDEMRRHKLRQGGYLDRRWLFRMNAENRFSPPEKKWFTSAVNQMELDGIINVTQNEQDDFKITLTASGYEEIYS